MPKSKKQPVDEQEAMNKLVPFSETLGKAAGEVWKIFVRRYLAKGAAEIFVSIVTIIVATDKLWTHHFWYWCIPFVVVMFLAYDAIQLLIDPAYFAMGDVEDTLKRATQKTNEVTIYNNR